MGEPQKLLTLLDRKVITKNKIKENAIYFISLAIFIFFAIFLRDRGFLSRANIMNILRQTAIISVMAVTYTFLLAAGQFDLSLGSVVGLSSLIGALALQRFGIAAAIAAALATGASIGAINGALVTKGKMPSFLMTLATQGIVLGLARWVTNLATVPVLNRTFSFIFGAGNIGIIPTLFVWTIVVVIIGHIIMTQTAFGRKVIAVGSNKTAAEYIGINADNLTWGLFIALSTTASLAGLLYAGRMEAARYSFGQQDLFTTFGAVIIGGNSVYGGRGLIIGALFGSLIFGVINNGLILSGLSVDQQLIFRGIIIIIAVALSPRD
jgi:ribose transport system permease protein